MIRVWYKLWQKAQDPVVERVLARMRPPLAATHDTQELWKQLSLRRQELGLELLSEDFKGGAFMLRALLQPARIWNDWAHQRSFALTCRLALELPDGTLQRLRHPLAALRYGSTSRALMQLLALVPGARAQRGGRWQFKPLALVQALAWICPAAFIWSFERELRARLHSAAQQFKPTDAEARAVISKKVEGESADAAAATTAAEPHQDSTRQMALRCEQPAAAAARPIGGHSVRAVQSEVSGHDGCS